MPAQLLPSGTIIISQILQQPRRTVILLLQHRWRLLLEEERSECRETSIYCGSELLLLEEEAWTQHGTTRASGSSVPRR